MKIKHTQHRQRYSQKKISKVQKQLQFKDFIIRKCVFFKFMGKYDFRMVLKQWLTILKTKLNRIYTKNDLSYLYGTYTKKLLGR